jgi:hypothetical protein
LYYRACHDGYLEAVDVCARRGEEEGIETEEQGISAGNGIGFV